MGHYSKSADAPYHNPKNQKKTLSGLSIRKAKQGFTVDHQYDGEGMAYHSADTYAFSDYDAMKAHLAKWCPKLGTGTKT